MQIRNTLDRWGAPAKLLHWLVVLFVIGQFVLANIAKNLPLGMEKLGVLARHKSIGITILMLAIIRLLWRLANPTPTLPTNMAPLQRRLAQLTHFALYALLFAMPLSGWAMSSAKNYPVSWFGTLQLPNFVAPSESAFERLRDIHDTLATALLVIAAAHLLGALKHQFIDKDSVLRRMLPFY
jgi:cytochrome b561